MSLHSQVEKYKRWLKKKSLAIFLFHGVIEHHEWSVRNYTRKHLTKDFFQCFLKVMKKEGCALSMDEVLWHLEGKTSFPDNAFAVTFDDGFENNYSVAAPVLADMEIPATFYVTSGYIATDKMSWTDSIEMCLEKISVGMLSFPWSNKVWLFHNSSEKIEIMNYLRGYVKESRDIDTDKLVSLVAEQCKLFPQRSGDGPLDKKMSWKQVYELSLNKLFLIGGHSHSHRIMAFLNDSELEEEIKKSLELIGTSVPGVGKHYAYPEGLSFCYDQRVIDCLKRYGVRCSPSAIEGINSEMEDPFRLKRIFVV